MGFHGNLGRASCLKLSVDGPNTSACIPGVPRAKGIDF